MSVCDSYYLRYASSYVVMFGSYGVSNEYAAMCSVHARPFSVLLVSDASLVELDEY